VAIFAVERVSEKLVTAPALAYAMVREAMRRVDNDLINV
jgi:hypothetical protein